MSKTGGGSTTSYGWAWRERNLLLSVTEPTGNTAYEYDGDGTRISKTQSGVKTKYINDNVFGLTQVLMETDNAGAVQAVYNYGNDLISMNRAGVNSYYHYDGLGSTRQMTDDSETVVASYTYDGFGNLIASTGTIVNTYGFTGEQQFGEADNLVFLRARYYKPSIGRFISRDPIEYRGGLNLYTYTGNNPINRIDPMGEAWYGRYCGPGDESGTPIDELDEACKRHDDCYKRCPGDGTFFCPPSDCKKACDKQLCEEAGDAHCGSPSCLIAKPIIQMIFCTTGYWGE